MKILKWVLVVVGSVILLFAAALAFIAATFDPNQYKSQAAELVMEKTQRTLTIEGDVRLMLFPKLGVRLGKTRLSEFRSTRDFAGLDDMRVSLALIPLLSRQVVVDQIQLDGLHASLVRHKDGKTNFDDLLGAEQGAGDREKKQVPAKAVESGQSPIRLEVEGIRISKAQLSWKDEATGAQYAVSDFNLKTGRVAPGVPAKFDLGMTIRASEPKVDLKAQLGGILMADAQAQQFSLSAMAFKVNGDAASLRGLAAQMSGSLGADLKQQTANGDLVIKFDDSTIKAKFSIADFAALGTTFDIAIDKLNVDRYLPPTSQSTDKATQPATPRPEQPIDFSPLKKLDVAGSLRIGDLTVSNIKAQDVAVELKAKKGRLDLQPLSATLYQGSMKGQASVDANSNRLSVKQNLAGVAIGPLLHDALGQDLLEGRGDVALDVTTAGNLVSAMKKALNGSARLELKDGAIRGINLAQSLRNAKAMLGGKREAEQGAAAGEKTDFSELTASFVIRNGIAHNNDLLAKSPFLRLTGEGDINLPDSTLNYLAKAAVVSSSAGQGGKTAADLGGLTVPVRVSGPFSALRYKLEFGSIVTDSVKQKLEEKKDAIREKVEDKLKDRLKKLF